MQCSVSHKVKLTFRLRGMQVVYLDMLQRCSPFRVLRRYPGGLKERPVRVQLEKAPEEILRRAVYGMLPKNSLRKVRLKRTGMCVQEITQTGLHSGSCCSMHANDTEQACVFRRSRKLDCIQALAAGCMQLRANYLNHIAHHKLNVQAWGLPSSLD